MRAFNGQALFGKAAAMFGTVPGNLRLDPAITKRQLGKLRAHNETLDAQTCSPGAYRHTVGGLV
ncbi:hypothetical protein [Burkholderia sp. FERM BP-3421]|uniref:hypothetical protein n=1 Tax=Burkholderia sp. FERM BP-3421 TaxID=1494466 RepID=UPI003FCDF7D6